jgi:hypothetical protein
MFAGFNYKLRKDDIRGDYYHDLGKKILAESKQEIIKTLDKYMCNDVLDGNMISLEWFPTVSDRVFLSHSHKDEDLVISFAGFLNDIFGIDSFVDSCIWGYADELIRIVDNKYCRNRSETYDYKKRNISTSHIHMMLTIALMKTMDSCECLFFINTPNSVPITDMIINADYTYSPWIYSEIEMSRMLKHRPLSDYRIQHDIEHSMKHAFENLTVKYQAKTDHLYSLQNSDIIAWQNLCKKNRIIPSLDVLYSYKGIIKK